MRRANSTGSIFKIKSGKRRKPWRVRVTTGWVVDASTGKVKQIIETIGYYASRAEAEKALVEYNGSPYDLKNMNMTFEEVYKKWSEAYFEELNSESSKRTVESAYKYCSSLYKMRMRDIRPEQLEKCLDMGYIIPDRGADKGQKRYASASTKIRMKSIFNLMFEYAFSKDIVNKNYAKTFKVSSKVKEQAEKDKKTIVIFSQEEIQKLWENVNEVRFVDMVLIGIYSGWRPQELAILKVKDVNLEEETMFGGLKTDAGKNRCVPIHPLIKPLVEKRYNEAVALGSEYLFNDREGQQGMHMTYDKYRGRFNKAMDMLEMKHRPHETRHTFATKAEIAGVKEPVRKLIMGHYIEDITERVYTHRDIEDLKKEISKIKE